MPSVTGAPFPECFETAEPKFGRDWAADLAQQHNADARAKVVFDRTTGTDTTDAEFNALMAQTDAFIAQTNKELNERKVRMLEHTVTCLKSIIERQRDALAKRQAPRDIRPPPNINGNVYEIYKCLRDGLHSDEADYKDLCLSIISKHTMDIIQTLIAQCGNKNSEICGQTTLISLGHLIARQEAKEENHS
jgi:hypothetical protein